MFWNYLQKCVTGNSQKVIPYCIYSNICIIMAIFFYKQLILTQEIPYCIEMYLCILCKNALQLCIFIFICISKKNVCAFLTYIYIRVHAVREKSGKSGKFKLYFPDLEYQGILLFYRKSQWKSWNICILATSLNKFDACTIQSL